ncbi:helix-turn-helix domain-containing protein [Longimicrobium terrae]|uniref:Transcriptional regulator with XRE-family HTH domain n=1 Tax=Longimicrobium terrae TaxID=1639882 RepID=A0A841GSE5_9BACT|nr:helix-turn-helix transcriptional regulator [Longimicrobium terrae]MBB4634884.1 transcriptional regulator with XRE-family HTH domain [Longimicrobium terrae]MBB6069279.1 transcriptional regulator with XRE-family HTH domain [Longimicrobium terrae]NNC31912.1 helix-turn-helix transcriptional regulator [Longimicrobium terrae]
MAKPFRILEEAMSPESRARSAALTARMLAELPLHEMRQARRMTQEELAISLGTSQASVSKMERRTDLYLSTLRRYIEAMGGELVLLARFRDGDVRLNQFADLDAGAEEAESAAG